MKQKTILTPLLCLTLLSARATPAILGTPSAVCVGSSITLTGSPGGGAWASRSSSIATVSGGIITGVAADTVTIFYTQGGVTDARLITVHPIPDAITGTLQVCPGTTSSLNSSPTGGTWGSPGVTAFSIGSTTGVVAGIAAGTGNVTYTSPAGCKTWANVTCNPNPVAIPDVNVHICPGTTTTFSNGTAGGTWISSNPSQATVGASTGIITGVSAGIPRISYVLTTGCFATKTVNVHPTPPPITGPSVVCDEETITLANAGTPGEGGTWTSGNTVIATINSGTGILKGKSVGTVTVSYADGHCTTTTTITVSGPPGSITGPSAVCVGSTITLATGSAAGIGTWISDPTSVATVNSSGIVTGVSSGTATIDFTGCGSTVSKSINVNPLPPAISGTASTTVGGTTTLGNTEAGGTWSSSNTSIATVNTTGVVSGISPGTAIITYTLPTGCFTTAIVSISPAAITGRTTLCVEATTTLSNASAGGSWESSDIGVATVDASGVVTGVSPGTATITYAIGTCCMTTAVVTVVSSIPGISGAPVIQICEGSTTTLSDAVTGGTWTSGNAAIAAIDAATGVLTAGPLYDVYIGARCDSPVTITYSLGAACVTTATVRVGDRADSLLRTYPLHWDTTSLCAGLRYDISPSGQWGGCTPGGSWVSSDSSVADVIWGGFRVRAIATGTATISHTRGNGCWTTVHVTVRPTTSAITASTPIIHGDTYDGRGEVSICLGSTTTLQCAETGGTWTSINTNVSHIVSSDNTISRAIVSGDVAATTNTDAIIYTHDGNECRGVIVRVYPETEEIVGPSTICFPSASQVLFYNHVKYGDWSSSNESVLHLSSTGQNDSIARFDVVGTGTTTLSYITGCGTVTKVVTVLSSLPDIDGAPVIYICERSTTTLSDAITGGTWSSSDATIASIDASTGVLTAGPLYDTYIGARCDSPVTITYSIGGTCVTTATVRVRDRADSLIRSYPSNWDTTALCAGLRYYIAPSGQWGGCTPGGSWVSSDSSVADPIWGPFRIRAISTGTATISHTRGNGCWTTVQVTVRPTTAPITATTPIIYGDTYDGRGEVSICLGNTTTLLCSETGGTWSSINTNVSHITSSDNSISRAIVSGDVAETTNTDAIIYTNDDNKCRGVIVRTYPETEEIVGPSTICYPYGSLALFYNDVQYGDWSSSNESVLHLSSTGQNDSIARFDVVGTGTTTLSYITGCGTVTKEVTVGTCGGRMSGNAATIVSEHLVAPQYNLFPNPGNGKIAIESNILTDKQINVRVTDYTGTTCVHNTALQFVNGRGVLDLSNFAGGVYFVTLFNNEDVKMFKVIILKQ